MLGAEINAIFLEAERAVGVEVHGRDLAALPASDAGQRDRIIAFDLFEQFYLAELIEAFDRLSWR